MQTILCGRHVLGPGHPTFVIAEAGINHNGSLDLAMQLVYEAFRAGADAVKFQKRTVSRILTRAGLEAPYNSPNAFAPTYGEHKKKLEFSNEDFAKVKKYADSLGITFLASVWDEEAADFVVSLGVNALKIASADLTNLPLLRHCAYTGLPLLVSTGMASIEDVDLAVRELEVLTPDFVLLHTTSAYPVDPEDVNLRIIKTLRQRYGRLVGYSGHDIGAHIATVSVALGVCVIEKHFTLDKTMRGSDHAASLNPEEFRRMMLNIRCVEKAMGVRRKEILPCEEKPRVKLAKSLVSKRLIRAGETFSRDNLTTKGPGSGISPVFYDMVLGRRATHDIAEDVTLQPRDVQDFADVHPGLMLASGPRRKVQHVSDE